MVTPQALPSRAQGAGRRARSESTALSYQLTAKSLDHEAPHCSVFRTPLRFKRFLVVLSAFFTLAGCGGGSQVLVITGDEMLPSCPQTPNCVSSLATDTAKHVEPFPLNGTLAQSMEQIIEVIRTLPRAAIVSSSPDSIQVEFRSLLGFVDDLIFVASPEEKVIHLRSAARSGTWDLGVNRRRVEKIRGIYIEKAAR